MLLIILPYIRISFHSQTHSLGLSCAVIFHWVTYDSLKDLVLTKNFFPFSKILIGLVMCCYLPLGNIWQPEGYVVDHTSFFKNFFLFSKILIGLVMCCYLPLGNIWQPEASHVDHTSLLKNFFPYSKVLIMIAHAGAALAILGNRPEKVTRE